MEGLFGPGPLTRKGCPGQGNAVLDKESLYWPGKVVVDKKGCPWQEKPSLTRKGYPYLVGYLRIHFVCKQQTAKKQNLKSWGFDTGAPIVRIFAT